jgi:hypothetical protein
MLLLTSTTSILQVTTSAAGAVAVQASWVDASGTTVTPGQTNTVNITTAATTTVVAAPAASTQRNVKDLSIRNTSATVAQIITVIHTDGTTPEQKYQCALAVGETAVFDQTGSWSVYDATGIKKQVAISPGSLVKTTVLTAGTTLVLGATTKNVRVRLRGGGGGGGGSQTQAAAAAASAGGAQGGYAERYFTGVTPGATLTYAIGVGGTGGLSTNGNGTAGGNTTITVNAAAVTANGGPGGSAFGIGLAGAASSTGGSAPALSTSGDLNGSGMPGNPGIQFSATAGISGSGGGEGAGRGSAVAGAGVAGLANTGGGGSGALMLNGSASVVGGSGAAGFIILDEYS